MSTNESTGIVASAPGSLMLLGEHAVLYGRSALVAAINRRIHVQLIPRQDREIRLESALGKQQFSLDDLTVSQPFTYVTAVLKHYQAKLPSGLDLEITAEFAPTLGLGSSAAVTVASIAVIGKWLGDEVDAEYCYQQGRQVLSGLHPLASAADIAASSCGGILHYRPPSWQAIHHSMPLTVVYTGNKVATINIVEEVASAQQRYPKVYDQLFQAMDHSVALVCQTLAKQDYAELGRIFNLNQGIFQALELSTPAIETLLKKLRACPEVFGAKLSGSGLGDCIIGVGTIPQGVFPSSVVEKNAGVKQLHLNIENKGVRYEST
ncbi:MAG: mevalonate kinase [Gammaproteobacteria bacterium]|nr:mevalonate kinase [Gammaproteobacteria bacterium]